MRIRRRYEDDGEHEAGGEDDSSLDGRGEGALGALAGGPETTEACREDARRRHDGEIWTAEEKVRLARSKDSGAELLETGAGRGEGALGALAGGTEARGRRGLWSRAPPNGREAHGGPDGRGEGALGALAGGTALEQSSSKRARGRWRRGEGARLARSQAVRRPGGGEDSGAKLGARPMAVRTAEERVRLARSQAVRRPGGGEDSGAELLETGASEGRTSRATGSNEGVARSRRRYRDDGGLQGGRGWWGRRRSGWPEGAQRVRAEERVRLARSQAVRRPGGGEDSGAELLETGARPVGGRERAWRARSEEEARNRREARREDAGLESARARGEGGESALGALAGGTEARGRRGLWSRALETGARPVGRTTAVSAGEKDASEEHWRGEVRWGPGG